MNSKHDKARLAHQRKTLSPKDIEDKLTAYEKSTPPLSARSSVLDPFIPFITQLYRDAYSHEQIAEFLKTIGIDVHSTTVGRFIKKKISITASIHNEYKHDVKPIESNNNSLLRDMQRPKSSKLQFTPYNQAEKKDK